MAKPQALPATIRRPAAIDRERVTVYEAALRGIGEERDCLRDVIGSGETRHRDASSNVTVGIEPCILR